MQWRRERKKKGSVLGTCIQREHVRVELLSCHPSVDEDDGSDGYDHMTVPWRRRLSFDLWLWPCVGYFRDKHTYANINLHNCTSTFPDLLQAFSFSFFFLLYIKIIYCIYMLRVKKKSQKAYPIPNSNLSLVSPGRNALTYRRIL